MTCIRRRPSSTPPATWVRSGRDRHLRFRRKMRRPASPGPAKRRALRGALGRAFLRRVLQLRRSGHRRQGDARGERRSSHGHGDRRRRREQRRRRGRAQPYGVYFPGGRCPTVGVSGLTLGGGWGFSCRHLGMTCDSLLSTEIVTASGDIVTASETENPDLFWAVRGAGGGNFGVHTSFTYAVAPTRGRHGLQLSRGSGGDTAALVDAIMRMQVDWSARARSPPRRAVANRACRAPSRPR